MSKLSNLRLLMTKLSPENVDVTVEWIMRMIEERMLGTRTALPSREPPGSR